MRPRHIPLRTCVVCRQTDAKRGLVRLVRSADGRVRIDPTGKLPGRGAYLCHNRACWEGALRRRSLERALKVDSLHPDDRAAILAAAAQYTSAAEQPLSAVEGVPDDTT